MSIYQQNFNYLLTDKNSLQFEIKNLKDEIANLNKYKNKQTILKSLYIHIVHNVDGTALDKTTEEEVKKKISKELQILVGQPISTISSNPQVIQHLIGTKFYPSINGKDYFVEMKTVLVIQVQLQLWVAVKEYKRGP